MHDAGYAAGARSDAVGGVVVNIPGGRQLGAFLTLLLALVVLAVARMVEAAAGLVRAVVGRADRRSGRHPGRAVLMAGE